jgi:hypothetical protein
MTASAGQKMTLGGQHGTNTGHYAANIGQENFLRKNEKKS